MRLRIEPGFVHCTTEPRFFVRSLDARDEGWACGYRWEIQFLDDQERGGATLEFGEADLGEMRSHIGYELPEAVIRAVTSGVEDYVDSNGDRRLPGFLGGGRV